MLEEFRGKPVRVFVVWEPVLPTDWSAPSSETLSRISDARSAQFWDHNRLISHSIGEHDRRGVVWDYIAVYPPGPVWQDSPPSAIYHGGTVIRVIGEARAALVQILNEERVQLR